MLKSVWRRIGCLLDLDNCLEILLQILCDSCLCAAYENKCWEVNEHLKLSSSLGFDKPIMIVCSVVLRSPSGIIHLKVSGSKTPHASPENKRSHLIRESSKCCYLSGTELGIKLKKGPELSH